MAELLGKTAETFQPDTLIAGSFPRVERTVVIKDGSGVYSRGTLLGKILRELGTPAAGGGNTGDGTISNTAMKSKTQVGTYKVVFTSATAFHLLDPDGNVAGFGTVGTNFDNSHMTFDLTAGGTPWVSGDYFDIPVTSPASEEWVKSELAMVDGANVPAAILGAEVDATLAAGTSFAYVTGEFSEDDVAYGTGHTKDSVRAGLEEKNIYLTAKDKLNPNFP